MKKPIASLILAAALAACGQSVPPPAAETPSEAPVQAAGEALALAPLIMPADTAISLNGELGCSFHAGEDLLVVAMGFVASQERAEALVKRDGVVVKVIATEPGGFDAMSDGVTFASEGLSVEVAQGAGIETGHEGVANNATLTARADGAERVYEGVWSCGP